MTKYTYPNISFNSKILGPTPVTPPWRDGYAIVGEFNRGPTIPTQSSQLSVLTSLYGEDKSSGSIALQQAMINGASNATVVRVVPGTESSDMFFQLSGDNVNIVPKVSYESVVANSQVLDSYNRTTGFKLTVDYIGSAIPSRINYSGVTVDPGVVTHPNFKGRAQMDFGVVTVRGGSNLEQVIYEDSDEVLSCNLYNSAQGDYQILSYTEDNNEYVEQYLEPGYTLRADSTAQISGLVIASNPFTLDQNTGLKGVLVKGAYSPASTYVGTVATVEQTKVLTIDTLLLDQAAFTPDLDQTTVLADAAYIINGNPYLATDVTHDAGTLTVTFAKTVAGAAAVGMSTTIVPVVSVISMDGEDTVITLKGVLSDVVEVSSKLNFSTDTETSYEVTEVVTPYNATTGTVSVKVAGDKRSAIKVKDYVFVTSNVATELTADFKVHFAPKTQYVFGYTFRPLDNSANLTAVDLARQYFSLPSSNFDSHIVISEGTGGTKLKFQYQTAPINLTSAGLLAQEYFGITYMFGEEDDTRNFVTTDLLWTIPFVKSEVTIGGDLNNLEDAYPAGTEANIILRDLENAVYSDGPLSSLFSDIDVDLTQVPYSFTGVPAFSGAESNRIYWNLIRYVAGPTASYTSNASGVITVDAVPDVLQLNPTNYSLFFNGQEYPVLSFDGGANTITIDPGSDLTASFLDLAASGETLNFISQTQTRDLLMRTSKDEMFSTSNYGEDKNFAFVGGLDSASYAFRDFYSLDGKPILRVRALTPGLYGNSLKITILPDTVTDSTAKYYLQVEDTDATVALGTTKTETFYLDNNKIDGNTGLYLDTRESNLIRAFFVPALEFRPTASQSTLLDSVYATLPLRVAPPLEILDPAYSSGYTRVNAQGAATIKDIPLTGGTDFIDTDPPTAIQARVKGYLAALKQIETADITWIGVVGINYGDSNYKEVFDYLKEIVNNSNPSNGGFRRAVVQLAPNVSPRQAATLKAQANSSQFIQIAGVTQGITNSGINYQQAPVVGVYIGLGASRPPHISPASTYGGRVPIGVNYSSIVPTPNLLEAFTKANTEVFYRDDTVGAYKFLNGLTSTNDPGLRYVSVKHTWDQIRDAIYRTLVPYKSQPATPQLRARIATACDALMAQYLRDEWLLRYAPTVCDERNNTEADLINGVINILIWATPTFPADYIRVTDVLDLRANISLTAQPGQSIADF